MAFSGPSVHQCLCFGEADTQAGTYRPCPPELCEAEKLLAELTRAQAELAQVTADLASAELELYYTHDRGDHLIYQHEWEAFNRWQREQQVSS